MGDVMNDASYEPASTIEIPLRSGDEVIELDIDQLPHVDEVLNILNQERAPLNCWINVGLAYYKKKLGGDFEKVLEEARTIINDLQPYSQAEVVQLLDMLANYCGRKASKEKNKELRNQLIARATTLFTSTDGIALYDQKHLLGRAFHFIYEGENWSQADSQLNFVLSQGAPSVPAFLGKACIAFNNKEYRNALGFYRRALRLQPNCPASVRLGIGHCLFKLNNLSRARLAFQRALDLDPNCVGALIGLAILDLNEKTQDSIKQGVQKLSRAYNLDPSNPMVLNHLVDHFFYKKEYEKVHRLALHAFHNTENEAMKAESSYQIARAFHVEENYDKAFQYYYLATQFASPNFLPPFYGLGQMYLHRNDLEHAAQAFEKVLKAYPNNYETLKILGRLYSQSNNPEKKKQARNLFKQVTEIQPDDVEAWIEYAQLLEHDITGALDAYMRAVNTLEEIQLDVSPEVLNNIGVLLYIRREFDQALDFMSRALARIQEEERENGDLDASSGDDYYQGLAVTVNYNLGRLYEETGRTDLAEDIYKTILLKHPTYIDCYLRFGCIARDRGQVRLASVWFNEALEVRSDHSDARSLIGMLHFDRGEIELAQKKFNLILNQPEFRADSYARIAIGNIWLNSLHHSNRDRERRKRHLERALSCYKAVLSADPKNIWAAHGIGCVLAHKGHVNESRDVFAQVREATAEFPDVWINIAHIYVEQKQYTPAIQMYENCMKKFDLHTDTDMLLYLARAHYKANQLKECKSVLLSARHIKPWDHILTYNLALVQKRLAVSVLQDGTSSFSAVYEAIADLSMARWTFDHLHKQPSLPCREMAGDETRTCKDLLSQAKYHLDRAKSREEQERVVKQCQELEREAARKRQQDLQEKAEAMRRERERRQEAERDKFIEKARQLVIEPIVADRKSTGAKKSGKRGRGDDFINDGDAYSDSDGESGAKKRERRRRLEGTAAKSKKPKRPDDGLSSKQRLRVVSKATVESSEGESSSAADDDPVKEVIFSSEDEPAKPQFHDPGVGDLSSDISSSGEGARRKTTVRKKRRPKAAKVPVKKGSGRKRRLNRASDSSEGLSESSSADDDGVPHKRKEAKKGATGEQVQSSGSEDSGADRRRARMLSSDEEVMHERQVPNPADNRLSVMQDLADHLNSDQGSSSALSASDNETKVNAPVKRPPAGSSTEEDRDD